MIRANRVLACLAWIVLLAACDHSGAQHTSSVPLSEAAAEKLATSAFLANTHQQIPDYSIRVTKETPGQWQFLIEGKGNFARPGYQWLVMVDKTTGKATVEAGE
jgi:hypothetical protein